MSFGHHVRRGLIWTASLRFLALIITWALTLVSVRLLAPTDYGLMATASIVTSLLGIVAELGLGTTLVQAPQNTPRLQQQMLAILLIANASLISLLLCAAPLIAWLFKEPRLVPLLSFMSFGFVATAFTIVPDAELRRGLDFRSISIIDLTSAVLGAGLTLALAIAGANYWALAVGGVAASFWRMLWSNRVARTPLRPIFDRAGLAAHLAFAKRTTLAHALWYFVVEWDVLLAARMLGTSAAGSYAVAKHLAAVPLDRFGAIFNQVMLPNFAMLRDASDLVSAHLLKTARLFSFTVTPACWGLAVLAPDLVRLLFGPKWEDAIVPMQLISVAIPLRGLASLVTTVAQSRGRADIVLQNAVRIGTVMPIAFFIGSFWGLIGMSCVWLLVYPVALSINIDSTVRDLGLRLWDIVKPMLPSVVNTLCMLSAVAALRHTLPDTITFLELAVMVAFGALAYAALSLAFNRTTFLEVVDLVAR